MEREAALVAAAKWREGLVRFARRLTLNIVAAEKQTLALQRAATVVFVGPETRRGLLSQFVIETRISERRLMLLSDAADFPLAPEWEGIKDLADSASVAGRVGLPDDDI